MMNRLVCWSAVVSALSVAAVLAQTGAAPVEGTLNLSNKAYSLKHALAYETTIDNEAAIAVVLTAQAITSDGLKEARDAEKQGGTPDFRKPFLRLVFKPSGTVKHWSAAAGGTMIGRRSNTATGELKVENGRAAGRATVVNDPQGMFPTSFDVRFEAPLLKASDALPESTAKRGGPAANVAPSVTGVFKGNGKEVKLAYVSARWREPFSDKTSIALVFTEKDHSKEKKPDTAAMFGRFGSALIISIHEDGSIFSCQVVHTAHSEQKQGFSSSGSIEATEFTYADGKVEGEITTNGQVDTFGETWEVKMKFVVPLGETPKEFQVAKKPEKETKKPAAAAGDEDDDSSSSKSGAGEDAAAPAAAGPKAKELALTKDASDVDYKALVGQLSFKSKSDVKKACAELAANLKAQGWATEGNDMVNPQSSILRRKRGSAKLTIFVKPADGGSEVTMMTEGLAWD